MNLEYLKKPKTQGTEVNYAGNFFGAVFMLTGLVMFLVFAFNFKTSVDTIDYQSVFNLGLVSDRIIGAIAGASIFIFGAVLFAANSIINVVKTRTHSLPLFVE